MSPLSSTAADLTPVCRCGVMCAACSAFRCRCQIAGQLLFGVLADYLGRRRSFIATLSLLIIGAASSAASHSLGAMSVFLCLSLCRFVLGVGVGGEYPLSATVSSEASVATAGRGRRVSLVFSMQGVGLLTAPAVVLVLLTALPSDAFSLVWRLALGLGGLPALCMLYFRFRMKETAAFSAQSAHARDTSEKMDEFKEHWKDLLATAGSWFIFDVVFYANSLFSSNIVAKFIHQPDVTATADEKHGYLVDVALSTLYLALCALPGYFAATLVIDRWGRRRLQMFGQRALNNHSTTLPLCTVRCNELLADGLACCACVCRWVHRLLRHAAVVPGVRSDRALPERQPHSVLLRVRAVVLLLQHGAQRHHLRHPQ